MKMEIFWQIFKPDKRRIVISAILVLTFFAFFLDDTLPLFLQVLLGVLLFLPIMILIPVSGGVARFLFYAIILFWSYVLACLIIFIWDKLSKSKIANGGVG